MVVSLVVFRRIKLLYLALLLMPVLACQFSVSSAAITNAVMARDTQGDNYEPVGVTDSYPSDQPAFHAVVTISNAPGDTKVKAVWTAVDLGSAAAPNTTIDETELTVEGSRNIDFALTPSGAAWPPGAYKVDLYLNGKLDRTLNFTVAAPAAAATSEPSATPTPQEATATPAPTATSKPTATVEEPTAAPTPKEAAATAAPAKTPAAGSSQVIADAVTAVKVTALTSYPLGVTDTFPAGQDVVHTVVTLAEAPAGTKLKAVWTVLDVGEAAPPNTQIGETETEVEGSQNIDFTFTAGSQGFPAGTYQVEIYVNNALARTLHFSVVGEGTPTPAIVIPTPAPVGSCPPLPKPNYQPSGLVKSITMAKDTSGDNFEPVNPGREFSPGDTFHAVVAIAGAPDNTEFTAHWFVQDVGGAEPCNTLIIQPFTLKASGSRNLDLTLQPPPGAKWPLGVYRVEIYTNGKLDLDVDFRVK